ncbi:HEAT repeat domain-containing protein [Salinispora oceanensis]|uniref:HEAT repeat domain-containing protein n=1 Tax=Salinispora oceanensis TaxID=1050199 RepID=UPI000374F9EC|nr:HEAT repeat domain-containing protein [Salinispora oceanensis]
MNPVQNTRRAVAALSAEASSTRLRAAMLLGGHPDPSVVTALVQRCAVEPDFFVRDMLTWALTRLPEAVTLPKLLAELTSEQAQARSQALHSLSKINNRSVYPSIVGTLLRDPDDEVARTAWRAAVALVPEDKEEALAVELVSQLGRGDRDVRLSLSRALVGLGTAALPALAASVNSSAPTAREHAHATLLLLRDPEADYDELAEEARRLAAGKLDPMGREKKPPC